MFFGRSIAWFRGLAGIKDVDFGPRSAEENTRPQDISQELEGATALQVSLGPGLIGTIKVGAMTNGIQAVEGTYTSSLGGKLNTDYSLSGSTGELTISRDDTDFNPMGGNFTEELELSLTDSVPIDLTVQVGVGETTLDLEDLMLRSLDIEGGLGSTTIILPDEGSYEVTIEAGVGELIVKMPDGLEARVECSSDLSHVTVTNDALEKVGDNQWETSNYAGTTEHIRVKIEAGLGSIIIN